MQTERQIRLNFNFAKSSAAELENEAKKLSRMATDDFEGALAELQSAWKGENAERYLKKGNQLKEEMQKTVKALNAISSAIRNNAQIIYNAEMEALRIAQEREAAAKAAQNAEGKGFGASGMTSGGGSR